MSSSSSKRVSVSEGARQALEDLNAAWLMLIENALAARNLTGALAVRHAPDLPEGHAVLLASTSVLQAMHAQQAQAREVLAAGVTEAALAKAMVGAATASVKTEGEG